MLLTYDRECMLLLSICTGLLCKAAVRVYMYMRQFVRHRAGMAREFVTVIVLLHNFLSKIEDA